MKNVNIFIKSRASTENDCDESEFFTEGTLEQTADGIKLSYEENAQIGFENSRVSVTAAEDRVVIERTGAASSVLFIEKGKKHCCVYGTPYGDFTVGTHAYEINCGLSEDGGTLEFKYSVDVNSEFISENELRLIVTVS